MKSFTVTAFFPEVKPAHCAWQTVTVLAGDIAAATNRAVRELRASPGVAGKHVSVIKFTICEIEGSPKTEVTPVPRRVKRRR